MVLMIIIAAFCGGVVGYTIALGKDECPQQILGYRCKGDYCNHSRAEVEKAKAGVDKNNTNFRFRP